MYVQYVKKQTKNTEKFAALQSCLFIKTVLFFCNNGLLLWMSMSEHDNITECLLNKKKCSYGFRAINQVKNFKS